MSGCSKKPVNRIVHDVLDPARVYDVLNLIKYALKDGELTEELEEYLKKHKPLIDHVIKAAKIERCDWELDRYEDIWNGSNDYAYEFQMCSLVMLAEARYLEGRSMSPEVVGKFKLGLNFANHINNPINNPNSTDQLSSMQLKWKCYSFIHKYLNRHPEISLDDLKIIKTLLSEEYSKKPITLNDILDDKLKFARRALTDHRDQRPSEFSQCDKILAFKGDEGWKEFFDSSLSFYEKYSKNMRVAVNAPLAMRYFMISTVENSIFDDFDTFEEKYEKLPDDYVPTKEDYDDFIKDCGVGFPMFNGAPMGVIYYIEMSSITKRNALLVGVSLKLEYLKTGKLPDGVPVGSPKDAFGEQAFDLIKTEEGFKIKSRSYNVATNEQPEYEFKLGKSSTPGKIEYSGGDGSSMAEAVVITGAIDSMAGVRAERTWIEINHPGWKRSMQSLIQSGKKAYDVNEYTTESGETKTICFDITDFFGKY